MPLNIENSKMSSAEYTSKSDSSSENNTSKSDSSSVINPENFPLIIGACLMILGHIIYIITGGIMLKETENSNTTENNKKKNVAISILVISAINIFIVIGAIVYELMNRSTNSRLILFRLIIASFVCIWINSFIIIFGK
jgi:hypothetical protein